MLTIPVKGGLIGANGVLAIQPPWNTTNSANNENITYKTWGNNLLPYGAANLSHQDAWH